MNIIAVIAITINTPIIIHHINGIPASSSSTIGGSVGVVTSIGSITSVAGSVDSTG